ncbi:D-cysteine desulfhydrase family protein [Proteiniclasticum sp.]|uniref:1-aminocyclopropane-1-carboxylate deaminase/D-cysteine desulfhydrase n=1 Tax=Proteiniclasticum sp. TaxID=2053595 RepID=UPI00289DF5DC|nr:D-cysteine desulfhydrase family protein [Proteiniclasticum sp.]
MNEKNEDHRKLLNQVPKVKLGFLPTPLHHLTRLSKHLGVDIYIKRDDYAGISQFGGNKIRKLEYLLAEAEDVHADTVVTYGASQSNHAMQTAATCRRLGITPILYLVNLMDSREEPMGNMVLNDILGAEVHMEQAAGESFAEALKRCSKTAKLKMQKLRDKGNICYEIPMGGASATGTLGFIEAFLEMNEQLDQMNLHMDHLYHASGSGGTLAGLAAGKILSDSHMIIHGVSVGISHDRYKEDVAELGNKALKKIGTFGKITVEDFEFHREYAGPGYEIPGSDSIEAMKLLALTEGIFLDPVYTSKAFACMLAHIRQGEIEKGSSVLFWHTGGISALFAGKEILGI